MSSNQFTAVAVFLVLAALVGLLGHGLFYHVQENIYSGTNWLKPLSDLLGGQTSATSYFGGLFIMSLTVLLGQIVMTLTKTIRSKIMVALVFYLWPAFVAAVYTYAEYEQYLVNPYPDDHILDVILGWASAATIMFIATKVLREYR